MDKIYISHYHSPIGEITMAGNGEALIGLWFDGHGLRLREERIALII